MKTEQKFKTNIVKPIELQHHFSTNPLFLPPQQKQQQNGDRAHAGPRRRGHQSVSAGQPLARYAHHTPRARPVRGEASRAAQAGAGTSTAGSCKCGAGFSFSIRIHFKMFNFYRWPARSTWTCKATWWRRSKSRCKYALSCVSHHPPRFRKTECNFFLCVCGEEPRTQDSNHYVVNKVTL